MSEELGSRQDQDKVRFGVTPRHKLTAKRELFCRYYHETRNATEAYAKAYGHELTTERKKSSVAKRGSKLLKEQSVIDRLAEIADLAKSELVVSMQELDDQLMEVYKGAVEDRSWAAAVSAVARRIMLHGYDKSNDDSNNSGPGVIFYLPHNGRDVKTVDAKVIRD